MDFVWVSDCNFAYKTYVLETLVKYLVCVMDYVVCVMDFVWLLNSDFILFRCDAMQGHLGCVNYNFWI